MQVKHSTQSTGRIAGQYKVSGQQADGRKTAIWSLVCDYLIESFALYATSIHPVALFPIEPLPNQRETPPSGPGFTSGRRGLLTLVSTTELPDTASPRPEPKIRPAMPAACAIGSAGDTRHEQEIAKAVAALAELDDQTLHELGIPDRSQIERTVRYCRDC